MYLVLQLLVHWHDEEFELEGKRELNVELEVVCGGQQEELELEIEGTRIRWNANSRETGNVSRARTGAVP